MDIKGGFWVALDGIDAVGKTSQVKSVATSLRKRVGREVVTVTEFSTTHIGDLIRDAIKSERFFTLSQANLTPFSDTMCLFTDRLLNMETIIAPALSNGKVVLSDRGLASLIGYQFQALKDSPFFGSGRKAMEWLMWLTDLFPVTPQLNIILRAQIFEINKRIIARGEDPLNKTERNFLLAVDKILTEIAQNDFGRTITIQADQEKERVTEQITQLIFAALPQNIRNE